jgi:hypothetical protein
MKVVETSCNDLANSPWRYLFTTLKEMQSIINSFLLVSLYIIFSDCTYGLLLPELMQKHETAATQAGQMWHCNSEADGCCYSSINSIPTWYTQHTSFRNSNLRNNIQYTFYSVHWQQ